MSGLPGKERLLSVARVLGALPIIERVYAARRVAQWREANAQYAAAHPAVVFPPADLVQRTYGSPSYRGFHRWGAENARDIVAAIGRHAPGDRPRIAEWGCGLGRLAAHIAPDHDYTGFDIDPSSVEWCRAHLPGAYLLNAAQPPLPAGDGVFDVVFAVSIFTHLSEAAHVAWRDEILRVLKPGGVFLFTVHGEAQAARLLPEERRRFEQGRLVVRGGVEEGSRTYLAYHPERFVTEVLLGSFEHREGPVPACGQTLYVGRKPTP